MATTGKARAIGVNHIALEVGDIGEALAFYGRLFEFKLRGKSKNAAFIDLGDQFLALQKGRKQPGDDGRHFVLVVDDKEAVRKALTDAGIKILAGRFLDFPDPWGNRIEIVGYDNIQFTDPQKSPILWLGPFRAVANLWQVLMPVLSPTSPRINQAGAGGCGVYANPWASAERSGLRKA
jgi:catechol 2,3-dioxygenase-like lactoylglutathione lyase family enzyme